MTHQEPAAAVQPTPPGNLQLQHPSDNQSESQPKPARNVLALVALIIAIAGFIFACLSGAMIIGWVLLPISFVLAIVSLFMKGSGKGLGVAGLIISVVGTIVGVIVFLAVAASSLSSAFDNETTVVESQTNSTQAPAEDPASEAGTRENPVSVGSAITNTDWTVVVNSYMTDGNPTIAANEYNEAAPAGSHYEIVNYTVTYTGTDSAIAALVGVDVVTSAGNVINSFENFVLLDDSIGIDELFNGASTTGSAAFLVPDGETVLLRVRPGLLTDEVFVSP